MDVSKSSSAQYATDEQYRDNYDRIFGNKEESEDSEDKE